MSKIPAYSSVKNMTENYPLNPLDPLDIPPLLFLPPIISDIKLPSRYIGSSSSPSSQKITTKAELLEEQSLCSIHPYHPDGV
jgi:hypothetical protein